MLRFFCWFLHVTEVGGVWYAVSTESKDAAFILLATGMSWVVTIVIVARRKQEELV